MDGGNDLPTRRGIAFPRLKTCNWREKREVRGKPIKRITIYLNHADNVTTRLNRLAESIVDNMNETYNVLHGLDDFNDRFTTFVDGEKLYRRMNCSTLINDNVSGRE